MKSSQPFKKHVASFLDYCEIEKGLSNNTQRNYKQYLNLFLKWLEKSHNTSLLPHELTGQHVWDYRLYLARSYRSSRGTHLTKKSQNYYLIALRALLAYFSERDIDSLPSSKVKLAKQSTDSNITFLELREIEKILTIPDTKTSQGKRDRALMELLFSSGMRISELRNLNVDDMTVLDDNDDDKTYELSIVGKGRVVRTIFISPRGASWIRTYLKTRRDAYKPLFINYRTKVPERRRLSARYIQLLISRCARLAGLSKKVTPHTLRHTYATDLLAHGADLRSVQELLGHKNVSTTQVYTHITNKHLRSIHERFHGGNDDPQEEK